MLRTYALLFFVVFNALPASSQSQITAVACVQEGTSTTITFTASDAIPGFQRPEISKDRITFRLVNCVVAESLSKADCSPVTIQHRQVREFAVFSIAAKDVTTATASRINATTVSVVLTLPANASLDKPKPPANNAQKNTTPWKLDVIVIDAGHGGKDVGAKGVNGVYEKNVTLAIARKLRALVQSKLPDTKVVMTRDDDTFVELFRRTQIANDAKGKLFISIHCNSMPTIPHPAHGCETYILRPGRNEDAARVAERENSSVQLEQSAGRYSKLDAEQLIVATMAQRSFVRYSEELATRIQQHVAKATGLQDRGVSQAGFFVLVGASMPNVLFETAFLSNADDAEFISSAKGQHRTAEAMLHAIMEYAEMYETSLR